MKIIRFPILFLLILISTSVNSQSDNNSKLKLESGIDLATTYLWRGYEFGNGPVIQPWTQLSYGNLSGGIWGTTNFVGDSKEIDFYLKYNFKNLTLSFTDLFTIVNNGINQNYFDFNNSSTEHVSELGLSYTIAENFPLSIYGGMLLYGQQMDPSADGMNHSLYGEISYPGNYMDYSYSFFAGFVPTESAFYQTEGFSFINIGFNLGKSLKITDQFSIPTNLTLSTSPERKSICFAVKCSL